jgi:hypothetical protein
MPTDQNDRERLTDAAPPPEEAETSPHASVAPLAPVTQRPAIAPPARLPDVPDHAELGASALAASKPPVWWESSFIGQALGKFANDAEDIRKGRDQQHNALVTKLDTLTADNVLIRGEIIAFRKAVHEKDADHDRQLADLRRDLDGLRSKLAEDRAEFERRFAEQQRIVDVVNEMIPPLEKALHDAETRAAAAEARATQAGSGAS